MKYKRTCGDTHTQWGNKAQNSDKTQIINTTTMIINVTYNALCNVTNCMRMNKAGMLIKSDQNLPFVTFPRDYSEEKIA